MDARETIRNRAAGLFKNGGSRSNYFVLINLRGIMDVTLDRLEQQI